MADVTPIRQAQGGPDIEGIVPEKPVKDPFLTELVRLAKQNNKIDPQLYE